MTPARAQWTRRGVLLLVAGALVVVLAALWGLRALHHDRPRHEHLVEWQDYHVTSPHTIVITAWTGTDRCYYVRHVAREEPGRLQVAVIIGTHPDAPEFCHLDAVQRRITVRTQALAEELTVTPLPESEVDLRE